MGSEQYLAIDVGGTKTLFAVFSATGEIVREKKIATSHDYEQFKSDLAAGVDELGEFNISRCCAAFPGRIDLDKGVGVGFGNLPWHDLPILDDLQRLLQGKKVLIHNDAKLAGLSEALLLDGRYRKVLYLTISTGIGGGVVTGGRIDPDFVNFEPGAMIFEHDGQQTRWETFASGKALHEKYGQLASEINDPQIWQAYVKNLVPGFENLLAVIQPDAVVIGGGVGGHFDKFKPHLEAELAKINNSLVPVPPLLQAQRPEEAVIYGCYDYIKQNIE